MTVNEIDRRLGELAAEIDGVANVCSMVAVGYGSVEDYVLYGAVFAAAKQLKRISDEIGAIQVRRAVLDEKGLDGVD